MENRSATSGCDVQNLPLYQQAVLGVVCAALALSLLLNFICCFSKCFSGKGTCRLRTQKSQGSRHMEENPIYGNIIYNQTNEDVCTEADPLSSSLTPSSLRNPQSVYSDSQNKSQECYANLTLKAPRLHCGNSSSEIQYSGMGNLEEPPESEREDDGSACAVSPTSDLYASVQTPRTKTIDTADDGEEYANHL